MTHEVLIAVSSIIVLGVFSQWIAWYFKLPGILLLLIFGVLIGPITGYLRPDEIFGASLGPLVSLSVAIILFEGGLSLKFEEFKEIGNVVRNLVTVGALLSCFLTALACWYILGINLQVSVLVGAILVVSGPTVIIPLLRQVRLKGQLGPVLKWEGIMIDPIGVMVAVIVFEAMILGGSDGVLALTIGGVLKTILIGCGFGYFGAKLILLLLRRYWVPDFLQSPVALMLVVALFSLSNVLQEESGLLTTTLMGIVLTNQKRVSITHIIEFKENLRVLLISSLFILLSARIDLESLSQINFEYGLFLLALVLVIRPLVVLISSIGSELNIRERLFVGLIAPRGIVAASIGSLFSIELVSRGFPDADQILPIIFFVVFGTVTFYGIGAPLFAKLLSLYQPSPQGVLIVGAHHWGRDIAAALDNLGVKVVLSDTNRYNIIAARKQGLNAQYGSIYVEHGINDLMLSDIGRLISLTSNDEVNTLACLHFSDVFGKAEVYQICPDAVSSNEGDSLKDLRSRILFSKDITYKQINDMFNQGAKVKSLVIDSEEGFDKVCDTKGVIPMFVYSKSENLQTFTEGTRVSAAIGDSLIYLELEEETVAA